jgi:hypothetical protein
MAERQKCQSAPLMKAGDSFGAFYTCGDSVVAWRECGRGCGRVFAYCDLHGGDARAEQECAAHHLADHPEDH